MSLVDPNIMRTTATDGSSATAQVAIETIIAQTNDHDARIGTLEGVDTGLDARVDALEAADVTLDARLDTLEGQNLNTRLTAAEADVDALQAADVSLDSRLDTAEADINNLETADAALDARLDTQEAFHGTAVITGSLTASVNDWAPTGIATAAAIDINSSTSGWTITGIDATGSVNGRRLIVINRSGQALTLTNQSASSAAANRFQLRGNTSQTLSTSGAFAFEYVTGLGWFQLADSSTTVSSLTVTGTTILAGAAAFNGNTTIGNAASDTVGFYGVGTPTARQSITALTDNSGGTANDTLEAIGAIYSQSEVRNNFADLAAKVNALRTILVNLGLVT